MIYIPILFMQYFADEYYNDDFELDSGLNKFNSDIDNTYAIEQFTIGNAKTLSDNKLTAVDTRISTKKYLMGTESRLHNCITTITIERDTDINERLYINKLYDSKLRTELPLFEEWLWKQNLSGSMKDLKWAVTTNVLESEVSKLIITLVLTSEFVD